METLLNARSLTFSNALFFSIRRVYIVSLSHSPTKNNMILLFYIESLTHTNEPCARAGESEWEIFSRIFFKTKGRKFCTEITSRAPFSYFTLASQLCVALADFSHFTFRIQHASIRLSCWPVSPQAIWRPSWSSSTVARSALTTRSCHRCFKRPSAWTFKDSRHKRSPIRMTHRPTRQFKSIRVSFIRTSRLTFWKLAEIWL